jgi:predicted dehydrogenase
MNRPSRKAPKVERREFLKGIAAAPALASLGSGAWTRTARADRSIRDSNDVIQVGVIGVGKRGQGLLISAGFAQPGQLQGRRQRLGTEGQEPLGIRISGICDIYDPYADWGVTAAGQGARRYRTHQELLADKEIDAVIIATPDHWHAPMAAAAARAGKHVYLEKCFTHQVPETFELLRAVKESKVILQLGHQRRSGSLYSMARDIVTKGVLGKVTLIQTFSNRNTANGAWVYAIPPEAGPHNIDWPQFIGNAPKRSFDLDRFFRWRKYWDYGTGLLGDLFSHEWDGVDLVMGGLGMPATAVASGGVYFWKEKREVPDVLQVVYEYPQKDLTLVYNATQASSFPRGQLYMGSEATMDLSRGVQVYPDRESPRYQEKIKSGEIQPDRPLISSGGAAAPTESFLSSTTASGESVDVTYLHLKNWVQSMRSNQPAACNEDVGWREAITTHMAVLSYKWGCRVRWDSQKQKVLPDVAGSVKA